MDTEPLDDAGEFYDDEFRKRLVVAAQTIHREFKGPFRDGKLVLRTWRTKKEAPYFVNKWWARIATSPGSKDAMYVSVEDEWTYVSYSNGKTLFEWRTSTFDLGSSTANMVEVIRAAAEKYLQDMHMVYRSYGNAHES